MTLLDKAIKALEPFARSSALRKGWDYEGNIGGSALTNGDLYRAAEIIAELRAFKEKPPGFKEWLKARPWISDVGEPLVRDAYAAGHLRAQLSGMPEEVRETLMEACRIARDTMRPEFDAARKWLEEGR